MLTEQKKANLQGFNNPLAEELVRLLPLGPVGLLHPLLGNELRNIQLADTRVQVHVMAAHKRRLVDELVHDVEDDDDGRGEVDLEEGLDELAGCHVRVSDRREAGPELGDEHEAVEDESDPGTNQARLAAERELVERVALHLPTLAEPDVREADGAPGEDGAETGEGKHPVEGVGLL